MNLSLSFIRGMVASINPCGFVLLPTYLMYFLGVTAGDERSQRAPISRALFVGLAVSSGFIAVFFVIGAATQYWTSSLLEHAKYATAVIGVLFIGLGIAMLFGYKLPFATPSVQTDKRDRTVRSMFVYGVAYATASLGCTLPLFISTLFQTGERVGYWSGVANVLAYAAGMALVVVSLTLALATANIGFVHWLRSKMQYVEMVSGAFVLLSGAYLLWYFWQVDVREQGDPITDAIDGLQRDVQTWLNGNWQLAAWALGAVVIAAVGYSFARERNRQPHAE
ncbi:MAG: cytochrome c biogenesis CcdA family protein [Actinomycetota bacterium]|nr:cytochrome c biogenesis CcdA family protein [Actinomycetota bacterium]